MEPEQRRAAKERMLELMEAGMSWQEAATTAGVQTSRATAYRWRQEARTRGEAALQDGRHGHPAKVLPPILHWLELSITMQPDFAATGAHVLEHSAPAEKRAISMPLKLFSFSVLTETSESLKGSVFPSDLSDAKSLSSSTGKSLCSKVRIISLPTAPVAPTTATAYLSFFFSISF